MFKNKIQEILLLSLALTSLVGCQSKYENVSAERVRDEELAETYLAKARQQRDAHQYDAARKTIQLMRDTCRLALEGREAGIVLLDSIELLAAQEDTTLADQEMRVQFYVRKLEHDLSQRKTH